MGRRGKDHLGYRRNPVYLVGHSEQDHWLAMRRLEVHTRAQAVSSLADVRLKFSGLSIPKHGIAGNLGRA